MSIHRSLVIKSALARSRNVFTRVERLKKLEEEGRWSEGDSVYGLPKVKTQRKTRKSKKEKKAEAAAAAEAEKTDSDS
ncbi:MAG: small basic protein [Planctomycetota bacterium]|jgi:small basic protein (TIGR04137 family)